MIMSKFPQQRVTPPNVCGAVRLGRKYGKWHPSYQYKAFAASGGNLTNLSALHEKPYSSAEALGLNFSRYLLVVFVTSYKDLTPAI